MPGHKTNRTDKDVNIEPISDTDLEERREEILETGDDDE